MATLVLATLGCAGLAGGTVVTPPEARIDVRVPTLAALDAQGAALLERHLAGNPNWAMREEPGTSCREAYRKEPSDGGIGDAPAGIREVSLNGYYVRGEGDAYLQTRVALTFGCDDEGGRAVVTVGAAAGPTQLAVEEGAAGAPGGTSRLVVEGGAGVRLVIYEQARRRTREFTVATLVEVDAEIATVLAAREELVAKGFVAALTPADAVRTGPPVLTVEDGMQPGIFVVTAWANPAAPGAVWVRARFAGPSVEFPAGMPPELGNVAIGTPLSAGRVRDRTVGRMGWSADPTVLFPYQAELTVYEGGWDDSYRARFELVFRGDDGAERILVADEADIEGWEH